MKKTQLKDAGRNIKKNFLTWLSVIFIAAIAVTAFIGITFAAKGMRGSGDDFYTKTKFRDLEVVSGLMLYPDDIERIEKIEGVKAVEKVYQTDARLVLGNHNEDVTAVSLTKEINIPQVVNGALPEQKNECAIEECIADALKITVGDTVKVLDSIADNAPVYLTESEFKVTAIVLHPDHIGTPEGTPGRRYVLVPDTAFDPAILESCCMKAEVLLDNTEGINRFSDEYLDTVAPVKEKIEELGNEIAPQKFNELKNEVSKLMVTAKEDVAEAQADLDAAVSDPTKSSEYIDAMKLLVEEAKGFLRTAEREFSKIKEGRWFIFDARGNAGYLHLSSGADSVSSLSVTFSLFFVVIGALVIYTSVGRIMEEQRRLIGATKALGLYNREILAKYLCFGLSAALIGSILGILSGYFIIQGVVLSSYKILYVIGDLTPGFSIILILIVVFAAMLLSAAAVYLSCRRLTKSTAIELMKEKQPGSSSRKARKGGSLYTKLIIRNMRSELSRVIVTVVSVAGCCALLVTGFTMRGGAAGIKDRLYGKIVKYDQKLIFRSDMAEESEPRFEEKLNAANAEWVKINDEYRFYSVGNELSSAEVYCGNIAEINKLYCMNDAETGELLPVINDGVYIQNGTADSYGLKAGDSFVIYNKFMSPCTVKVAGIFSNYIGFNMVISGEYYEKIFDEAPVNNTYLIRTGSSDAGSLKGELENIESFKSLVPCQDDIDNLDVIIGIFTRVAGIMVIVAGLMAYFILLNINKMYITHKSKELSIMRINGFTVGEVKKYVLAETVFTTAAGILLGTAIGSVISYVVIRYLETPFMLFVHSPNFIAWIIAAVLTVFFTFGINAIALKKIKDLKLTDVA